ncbi:MAG TPA: peptide chain release factor N(5)-glutamine methyltransferase [Candidatus Hungatella pullicola]|nr:peptide chain release factor N(5)-glutamine methyltransferase [Candidatus Hungatella pullicola]
MSLTMEQLWDEGRASLEQAGIEEASLDAKVLLMEAFHVDMTHFLIDRARPLEESLPSVAVYRNWIEERKKRIPLQQILGSCWFMGLEFTVDSHVLIPRQDTETLVEMVLKDYSKEDLKVLDMCTGSGCIGLSIWMHMGLETVTLADISAEALEVARMNGERLLSRREGKWKQEGNLEEQEGLRLTACSGKSQIRLVKTDLFSRISSEDCYDVIVSNPPYIPSKVIEGLEPEVRVYEPRLALDGMEDGLHFYKILARECKEHLIPGGTLYLEIGHDQGNAVKRLLENTGWSHVMVVKDAPGNDRVVKAVYQP